MNLLRGMFCAIWFRGSFGDSVRLKVGLNVGDCRIVSFFGWIRCCSDSFVLLLGERDGK